MEEATLKVLHVTEDSTEGLPGQCEETNIKENTEPKIPNAKFYDIAATQILKINVFVNS